MMTCKERANALFDEWAKVKVVELPELFERYFIAQRDDIAQQHAADLEARDLRITNLQTECGQLQANLAELRDGSNAEIAEMAAVVTELREQLATAQAERDEAIGAMSLTASLEQQIVQLTARLAAAEEVIEQARKCYRTAAMQKALTKYEATK